MNQSCRNQAAPGTPDEGHLQYQPTDCQSLIEGGMMVERILVVDDEEKVCTYMRKFLRKLGYQVFTVLNGVDAIKLQKALRPHLVLLDVLMPKPDGLTVLQKMKEHDPQTSVIMVTALHDDETGIQALKLGADGYITKPIDPSYLQEVVEAKITLATL